MSCHTTSCHVMSRNVTSCYVRHVTSRHVLPRHVTSRHATSWHVMSRRKSRDGHTTNAPLSTGFFHNSFELSMIVFVGCPKGCRYHTASAVYDLVIIILSRIFFKYSKDVVWVIVLKSIRSALNRKYSIVIFYFLNQ